jgi:AcrR family transcriptional regulator
MKNKKIAKNSEPSRNVRRTKMALKNKLIELMKTKSIMRISVKEICDAADVGRSTFYAHYENQYNLLEEIMQETMSVFEEGLGMNQPLRKESSREIAQKIDRILEFIANNKNIIQIGLSENSDLLIQTKFINRLNSYLKKSKMLNSDSLVNEKISECYSVFFVHGVVALMQHWLENDMNLPAPEIKKIILSFNRELMQ